LPQYERGLCTDLYELTMAAAYFEAGFRVDAAFELFVRELPLHWSYLVCTGLEQVVSYLRNFRFSGRHIDYLRNLPVFARTDARFFEHLAGLRFSGTVAAMPEGTVAFAREPLLRMEAPIIQAQIVETFLLSMVNYQTLVATKAARTVQAAAIDGRSRAVVDFGSRRAHGPDAAVLAARAAFVGGCSGTSNVHAGWVAGVPVQGTQAHSFVAAFGTEEEAFRRYYESFGEHAVLLVDTYDERRAVGLAARLAPRMRGVRIDSGDLAEVSKEVRRRLDDAGCSEAMVFASGDLDEYRIADLVSGGAPIDGFGVGSRLVTGGDTPYLGGVYKLVAVRGRGGWEPRMKLSQAKATYPGRKQVLRFADPSSGLYARDLVASVSEGVPADAKPLLEPLFQEGELLAATPSLAAIRRRAQKELAHLPEPCRRVMDADDYPVHTSRQLEDSFHALAGELGGER
jgi:nicotinate phosphoribosyltransferase